MAATGKKAQLRLEAKQRRLAERRRYEEAGQRQAAAEMAKTQQETPLVLLTPDGAFVSEGMVQKLCPGVVHRTREGLRWGGPEMTGVMHGIPVCGWGAFEDWADASGEVNLAGRFEATRIFDFREMDPELRRVLGVGVPVGMTEGLRLDSFFDDARLGAASISSVEPESSWSTYPCGWARGATCLDDCLPIEVYLDYGGRACILGIRSLKSDVAAMAEWDRVQDRLAARDLEALATRLRGRQPDLAGELRTLAATFKARGEVAGPPAREADTGNRAMAPAPAAPAALMGELPFEEVDADPDATITGGESGDAGDAAASAAEVATARKHAGRARRLRHEENGDGDDAA